MHHEGELRCDALAAVDMDHHLSGTTYAKAPRGSGIAIVCLNCSNFGPDVTAGAGQTTLLGPET